MNKPKTLDDIINADPEIDYMGALVLLANELKKEQENTAIFTNLLRKTVENLKIYSGYLKLSYGDEGQAEIGIPTYEEKRMLIDSMILIRRLLGALLKQNSPLILSEGGRKEVEKYIEEVDKYHKGNYNEDGSLKSVCSKNS